MNELTWFQMNDDTLLVTNFFPGLNGKQQLQYCTLWTHNIDFIHSNTYPTKSQNWKSQSKWMNECWWVVPTASMCFVLSTRLLTRKTQRSIQQPTQINVCDTSHSLIRNKRLTLAIYYWYSYKILIILSIIATQLK